MITTGKLKRQVWMADDDEFDHIVKNSQRVLRLNDRYGNHPYVFTKSAMLCLYIKHTPWRGRQMQNFLWMIYEIYFRKTPYQTTIFAGK